MFFNHLECSMSNVCFNYIVKKNNGNKTEKTFKNEPRSKDAAAKKDLYSTSGVGKVNNIMRISIYLLTTTPTSHIYTL